MYTNQRQTNETKELRRLGGRWLKERRERAGLSQRQLAEILGVEYYTFISQIETGHGRIPPDRYAAWAEAIRVDLSDFVREILRYYDPVTFAILFDKSGDEDSASQSSRQNATHDMTVLTKELQDLQEQVHELQRLLGKKTMELEQMRETLKHGGESSSERQDGRRLNAKGRRPNGRKIPVSTVAASLDT